MIKLDFSCLFISSRSSAGNRCYLGRGQAASFHRHLKYMLCFVSCLASTEIVPDCCGYQRCSRGDGLLYAVNTIGVGRFPWCQPLTVGLYVVLQADRMTDGQPSQAVPQGLAPALERRRHKLFSTIQAHTGRAPTADLGHNGEAAGGPTSQSCG